MAQKPSHYVKAFDGSRGIGTLFVIVAHYGYLQCGWVAVQYFFVLSGFLITSILLRQRDKPAGSFFKTFYWRRSLRIFPVYYGYLALCALGLLLVGVPNALRTAWPWLCTYTWNLHMIFPSTHFDRYFAHLWSLSAEEQFYLLWPFVIFFARGRWLKALILGALVAPPLLRLLLHGLAMQHDVSPHMVGRALYLGTMFQFDAFAAGAAIAIWRLDRLKHAERWFGALIALALAYAAYATVSLPTPPGADIASPVGLVRAGASFGFPLFMVPQAQYLWGYSLVNLLSTLFVIVMCRPNLVSRILENRFLCYVGKMSYGMYVLHFPIQHLFMSVVNVEPKSVLGVFMLPVLFGINLAAAHLSFYYYEKRFLELKDRRFE